MALIHWRIPARHARRDYSWDTRAVIAMPGGEWSRLTSPGRLSVRAGPAFSWMLEGPDAGIQFGGHVEAAVSRRVWIAPITAGAGWLWLSRDQGPNESTPGDDQLGLMLFAGIHF